VPRMGESISQGVLAKWNVEIGSFVNAGDILASVETDKVPQSLGFRLTLLGDH
jgi:pyruvate dehydrogenase E2 component (dihydrolipoamide acetyltransferase)